MDPIKNPFSPGAGSPPPELVGRDPILEQARILLGRVKARRSEKSILLTGLRGVGKTVLLNEIERLAKAADYRTIVIEAHENKPLGPLVAQHLLEPAIGKCAIRPSESVPPWGMIPSDAKERPEGKEHAQNGYGTCHSAQALRGRTERAPDRARNGIAPNHGAEILGTVGAMQA